jgi:hypothetical protein
MNGAVVRDLLLTLQGLVVAILALHDWIPLGAFNKVREIRAKNKLTQLVTVTALQTLPFAFGLVCSAFYRYSPYPTWLYAWLWISYAAMFLGQIQAWWIPFIIRSPRAIRARDRVTPNTLHLILHLATIAILALLIFEPR